MHRVFLWDRGVSIVRTSHRQHEKWRVSTSLLCPGTQEVRMLSLPSMHDRKARPQSTSHDRHRSILHGQASAAPCFETCQVIHESSSGPQGVGYLAFVSSRKRLVSGRSRTSEFLPFPSTMRTAKPQHPEAPNPSYEKTALKAEPKSKL